jgi:hypothetical protein
MTPAIYPLRVVAWPAGKARGDVPVFWIIERQPMRVTGGGLRYEGGEVEFAVLGPYDTQLQADDGLRREVARREGFMLVECVYCRRLLGAQHCLPRFSRLTSHGTCPDCDGKMRKSLGLEPEGEAR